MKCSDKEWQHCNKEKMGCNGCFYNDEIEIGEIWKNIKGFPNYQVSNLGRVRSIPREKTKGGILKECISKTGYVYVNLYKDGQIKRKTIHTLVMGTFYEVNHKDGNKQNNNINNLEYVTKKQNIEHRFRVLKQKPFRKYNDIDWNNKEDVNRYHRMYYRKNLERNRKYQREYKRTNKTNRI